MGRKYIGVDLGAWYGNKTRIAILEEKYKDGKLKLYLISIDSEPMVVINDPYERNKQLVEFLKNKAKNNAIIGIDAPFAIPYYLYNTLDDDNITEPLYSPNDKILPNAQKELLNQMIYDNSARFVFQVTREKVLAPAGDKIGKMTARMVQIASKYKKELNVITTPYIDTNTKGISTIEVYPRATLHQLIKATIPIIEVDPKATLDQRIKVIIPQYKNKNSVDYFKNDKNKMLNILKDQLEISEELENKIKTDDDYDAVICALTTYLIDKNGFEKPNHDELKKFTNSFIYIPKIKPHID
jgi:predicted RNase H-like nuclease